MKSLCSACKWCIKIASQSPRRRYTRSMMCIVHCHGSHSVTHSYVYTNLQMASVGVGRGRQVWNHCITSWRHSAGCRGAWAVSASARRRRAGRRGSGDGAGRRAARSGRAGTPAGRGLQSRVGCACVHVARAMQDSAGCRGAWAVSASAKNGGSQQICLDFNRNNYFCLPSKP